MLRFQHFMSTVLVFVVGVLMSTAVLAQPMLYSRHALQQSPAQCSFVWHNHGNPTGHSH